MVTWAELRLQEQDHFLFCFDSIVRILSVRVRVFGVRAFLITPSGPKLTCPFWALFQGASRGLVAAATSWRKESWTSQLGFRGPVLPVNHCDGAFSFPLASWQWLRPLDLKCMKCTCPRRSSRPWNLQLFPQEMRKENAKNKNVLSGKREK